MHPKTTAAVDAICDAIEADKDAGPALLAVIHDAVGFDLSPGLEISKRFKVAADVQRAIGGVAALDEIGKKARNVAKVLMAQGEVDNAELFVTFAENLDRLAKKRSEPITKAAADIRKAKTTTSEGG